MRTDDLVKESYRAITTNKVRSFLTVLGIIIGIGSVITMIAVGKGTQKTIEDRISSIGTNLLTIQPGRGRGIVSEGQGSASTLSTKDLESIKTIGGIQAVAPVVTSRQQIIYEGANTNTSVIGTTADYLSMTSATVAAGNLITPENDTSRAKVVVLGNTVFTDVFPTVSNPEDIIGTRIRVGQFPFTIIGVLAASGSGFGSADDSVIAPFSTVQQFYTGKDSLNSIYVQAESADTINTVQDDITSALMINHKLSDPTQLDFRILNQVELLATATQTTQSFTLLLSIVAAISLLVGGIGIMNMMLTTVTERTKEIGLRKALGATKSAINMQFLIESMILTFLGGVLGVLLGYGLANLLSKVLGVQTVISSGSIILAVGISTAIGLIFGWYPARKASNLNPIDALRSD